MHCDRAVHDVVMPMEFSQGRDRESGTFFVHRHGPFSRVVRKGLRESSIRTYLENKRFVGRSWEGYFDVFGNSAWASAMGHSLLV